MSEIRCIIVDDEPLSLETLEAYIEDTPNLQLVAQCQDAFQALDILKKERIDLIFLDINMPKLSGISMLKSMENPPLIVFTTAYSKYAVEGFELDAIDYLLKPFSFERFIKAVNKASDRLIKNENTDNSNGNYIMLKSDKKMYKIDLEDILYIQAYGDYVKVVSTHKSILTHSTMKNMEESLKNEDFIRIHKSYIIALKHIIMIEGNQVKINDEFLPIGISYKENLFSKL